MNSVNEVLAAEFEALKADIIAAYNESDVKASGNWAATVEVQATDTNAKLLGAGYINGRGPGKPPPSQAIEQWLKDKGIANSIGKNRTVSSLAVLIARKIGRQGWKPKNGGSAVLVERVVTPQRIQQIIDKAGDILLADFTRQILDYLKPSA